MRQEHGGFFDHVPPPQTGVPPPGDRISSYPDKGFPFDRLGVRIPTIVASPWIPRRHIESAPPQSAKRTLTSEYELTSIMATARILLGMDHTPLTDRDAWAATFEHVLSLKAPRTDCPMHLPSAPTPTRPLRLEAALPLNELQLHIGRVHAHLARAAAAGAAPPTMQGHVGEWHRTHREQHEIRQQHARARRQRAALLIERSYSLTLLPGQPGQGAPGAWSGHWNLSRPHPRLPWSRVSIELELEPAVSMELEAESGEEGRAKLGMMGAAQVDATALPTVLVCLDFGGSSARPAATGAVVGVMPCGPADGSAADDAVQRWVHHTDATLRPYSAPGLCLTNHVYDSWKDSVAMATERRLARVTLEGCDDGVNQHWAWHGKALGPMASKTAKQSTTGAVHGVLAGRAEAPDRGDASGQLEFGDDAFKLGLWRLRKVGAGHLA